MLDFDAASTGIMGVDERVEDTGGIKVELQTISEVTRQMGISTRTLRYYEQIGLIESKRVDGYAYRMYDEAALGRITQILILRALRIPLKEIERILREGTAAGAIEVFTRQMNSLDEEIASLSTIRDMLRQLIGELHEQTQLCLKEELLHDPRILSVVAPLLGAPRHEEKQEVIAANRRLNRLTDRDVRIVYLPPAWVASYRAEGFNPEADVIAVVHPFVRQNDLVRRKPDLRQYGFNAPNPHDATNYHGYEMWVTIPDEMDVPAPLEKKYFKGGLYAAYAIPFGAFEMWDALNRWVSESTRYAYRGDWNENTMFDWLEEHLNFVNHVKLENSEPEGMQLDLLIPIREKS